MSPPIELAALYRRVSTGHQDNSLEVQEALNNEYCTRLNLPALGQPFEDPDTSGSVFFVEREGGRALMERLRAGGIKHLVTAKQDRLGRDTLDTITTIRAIWNLGITPHFTCEGGAFPRTPQNELLFEIKASVAQYERNLIRERTRLVLQHKFIRHELIGTVPFGYDARYTFRDGHVHICGRALQFGDAKAKRAPEPEAMDLLTAHGDVTDKRLTDNEAEQGYLRTMSLWRQQGRSLTAVAKELNRLGVPTKRSGPWNFGTVDKVLRSRHAQRLLGGNSAAEAA